jgi:predicted nucleic acid-binding Zn ribbon protein
MKLKCPSCGFENDKEARFCENCEEPLPNPYTKNRKNEGQSFKHPLDEEAKTKNRIEKEERIRAEAKVKAEKEIKEKEQKKQGTDCLVFIIIVVAIFLIYFLPAIKEDREFRNKSALLALSSEDILVTSETGYYITRCYVTNKGDSTCKGSVDMIVEDTDGGPLYASTSNAWPEIELKPGERDYLIAKIPMNEYLIQNAPQGILVIVWSWGSHEVTKRVKIR